MTPEELKNALDAEAAPIIDEIKRILPCERVHLAPGMLTLQTDPTKRSYDLTASFGRDGYGGGNFRFEISIGSFLPFDPTRVSPARTYYRVAAALLEDGTRVEAWVYVMRRLPTGRRQPFASLNRSRRVAAARW